MDKNFHDLLNRYVNGNCTPEENAKVNRWYEEIEDKTLGLAEEDMTSAKTRVRAKIRRELSTTRQQRSHRYLVLHPVFKVAAALVVAGLVGIWLLPARDVKTEEQLSEMSDGSSDFIYLNQTGTTGSYKLPDGSTVQLEPFGKIHFSKKFSGERREVYLTGKAFFDIVKDPSRPFYVYSGSIATRVLGTSFFVNADERTVEVKVITGSVSVFEIAETRTLEKEKNSAANGVVLSPNEKVKYFMEGGHWVTGLVEDPMPVKAISEETFSLVFENASLREVLADVSERYGIEVITENAKIGNCTFTGNVSKMSLYDMLDVISNAVGSTYEVKGTRILMSGKGCD